MASRNASLFFILNPPGPGEFPRQMPRRPSIHFEHHVMPERRNRNASSSRRYRDNKRFKVRAKVINKKQKKVKQEIEEEREKRLAAEERSRRADAEIERLRQEYERLRQEYERLRRENEELKQRKLLEQVGCGFRSGSAQ
ncbi:hypothetical protein E4U36_002110 [Claviceps purpurea]|nr:hypothetical protein E4U36_002110 [Claviceps purpurea]